MCDSFSKSPDLRGVGILPVQIRADAHSTRLSDQLAHRVISSVPLPVGKIRTFPEINGTLKTNSRSKTSPAKLTGGLVELQPCPLPSPAAGSQPDQS